MQVLDTVQADTVEEGEFIGIHQQGYHEVIVKEKEIGTHTVYIRGEAYNTTGEYEEYYLEDTDLVDILGA